MNTTETMQPIRCAFAEGVIRHGRTAYEVVQAGERDGNTDLLTPYPPAVGDLVTLSRKYDGDYDVVTGTFVVIARQWVYCDAYNEDGTRTPEGTPDVPVIYYLVEEKIELASDGYQDESPWACLQESPPPVS